jgi:AcrR family transcriptional regulator
VAKDVASKPETGARERILAAAYAVAEQSGAAALTLDAVAAKAKVSKGGLLYHFPSKQALVSGMVDGLCRACRDLAAAAAQADPEPAGRSARAYLAACAGDLWRSSRWTALVGALVFNPELLAAWRADVLAGWAADEEEGVDPAAAEIVRLAADGMWVRGILGLPGPGPELKAKVVAELNQVTRGRRQPLRHLASPP